MLRSNASHRCSQRWIAFSEKSAKLVSNEQAGHGQPHAKMTLSGITGRPQIDELRYRYTLMGQPLTKGIHMKRFCLTTLIVLSVMLLLAPGAVLADSHAKTIAVFKSAPAVQPFFESAYGYAVFPLVGKGALIVGATHGKGKVYRGGIATGTAELNKMTIGFQFGGQAFSEMVFFEDQRAYDEFTRGSFNFDVNASAVAITAGAQASAGSMGATAGASIGPATGKQAGTSYYKGMATFIHAKGGLMIEASIGGQTFEFEPYQLEK